MLFPPFNGTKTMPSGRPTARRPATSRRPIAEELERRELLTLMMVNSPKVSLVDGAGAPSPAAFTVQLNAPSGVPVTVQYQTADLTAHAGSDYVATQGSLTFAPGVTAETVSVPVLGQTSLQPTKAFGLRLSNASNVTVINSQGVCSIVDVTPSAPQLSINDPQIVQGVSGTQRMIFTVSLNEAVLNKPVTVTLTTVDATAIAGVNYRAKTQVLTFQPGQTSLQFSVVIYTTPRVTSPLAFFVAMSAANVDFKKANGVGLILP